MVARAIYRVDVPRLLYTASTQDKLVLRRDRVATIDHYGVHRYIIYFLETQPELPLQGCKYIRQPTANVVPIQRFASTGPHDYTAGVGRAVEAEREIVTFS